MGVTGADVDFDDVCVVAAAVVEAVWSGCDDAFREDLLPAFVCDC